MAYSDFILASVKKQFQLNFIEKSNLFQDAPELQSSPLLQEILQDNLPLALASNTDQKSNNWCSHQLLF